MSHYSKDFPKPVIAALARQGIRIIGACAIPDSKAEMPWANASRGYQLDDNGTHRIRSYAEVKALADPQPVN
jgi:hypothetical protein